MGTETTLARIAQALGVAQAGAGFFDLLAGTGFPTGLAALGIAKDQLETIVRLTVETDHGNNPGLVDPAGLRSILDAAFEGRRPNG